MLKILYMKLLAGLLAFMSSLFTINSSSKSQSSPPLNAAVIVYRETYFAPAVVEPGNFPWADKLKKSEEKLKIIPKSIKTPPPLISTPILTLPLSVAAPLTVPATPPPDSYLANPEPIINWFGYSSFNGTSAEGSRTLPEINFDREYWRIEVLAYWAPKIITAKPEIQKDYFKLETYEKGTDKLIYTMTSDTNETIHKFQAFRKPGTYYFKIYTKDPSQYEITFTISSKLVQ